MEIYAEALDRLAQELLRWYMRALCVGRMDVAEHLLRALEQLAAPGPSSAALEAAYLDRAAQQDRRSRSTP